MSITCRTCVRECDFAGTEHPTCVEWEDREMVSVHPDVISEQEARLDALEATVAMLERIITRMRVALCTDIEEGDRP